MGMESYDVNLITKTGLDLTEVDNYLTSINNNKALPKGKADQSGYYQLYYEYRDGLHVIEFELLINQQRPSHPSISIRFALCNPPTIDPVYIKLVKEIACRFDMNLVIMKEFAHSPDNERIQCNSSNIDLTLQNSIEIERRLWQKDFGCEVAALTCSEAIRAFILPKCT